MGSPSVGGFSSNSCLGLVVPVAFGAVGVAFSIPGISACCSPACAGGSRPDDHFILPPVMIIVAPFASLPKCW